MSPRCISWVCRWEVEIEHTSSGYRSLGELRGMCSVQAKVFIPFEMAVRITSSSVSLA